jgi:TetR/AcrR family transcriptional regulator, transcriptional repressor for nem operon
MSRHLEQVLDLRVDMDSPAHSFERARFEIVRAAGDLFHKVGAEATTLDEVIEAAGVTKDEFRQHFRCKLELVNAVLRSYFEMTAADKGPLKYDIDTWSDLQECFASHLEFQKKFKMTRGCPVGMLGSDLKERDDVTRQSVSLILDLMLVRFESFFSREKVARRLASNVDVEQLANFSVAIIQGAMLAGKVREDRHCVESTLEDLLAHLKRYAKVPTSLRQRPNENRHPKQLSAPPRTPTPAVVVELHDTQDAGDSAEIHPAGPRRPEDEV